MKSTNAKRKSDLRRNLLAKVHIAKKDLCLFEDDYRDILNEKFGVSSAGVLSNRELDELIGYFQSKGWRPKKKEDGKVRRWEDGKGHRTQTEALREKADGLLSQAVEDGHVRSARGLVRSICGVDRLEWCGEAVRLKKLLAVLRSIMEGPDAS